MKKISSSCKLGRCCRRILPALLLLSFGATAAEPLRVLLITGGCCHDYARQKDFLKQGLEKRAHVKVDQVHTDDSSTRPPLAILGKADYARNYAAVIHDECASDVSDPATIEQVLKPHREGIPGVNLHCAMHSYRIGNPNDVAALGTPRALWFEYLGLQSSGHGPQEPIEVRFDFQKAAWLQGLPNWTTTKEELYNNVKVHDGVNALARGRQIVGPGTATPRTNDFVVVWTNEYGPKKTRVFSTTLGHNNATVEDDRYLDLVTRGLLWATGHLEKDGTPEKGYGPGGL